MLLSLPIPLQYCIRIRICILLKDPFTYMIYSDPKMDM